MLWTFCVNIQKGIPKFKIWDSLPADSRIYWTSAEVVKKIFLCNLSISTSFMIHRLGYFPLMICLIVNTVQYTVASQQ